ncbi:MAG: ParM/StbA family protein [Candidatus Binatia bacterium]
MRIYGVDIGYGYTKIAAPDRAPVVIPSIVGSNEEPSYRSDIGDRIKVAPLTLNGHSYLVGEAAKRFSRHHYRIFDSTWAESPYYLLLFVAALLRIEKPNDESISIVTGLPVSHYTQERSKQIQDLLARSHNVNTTSGQTSLRVDRVKVIPQPFGSFFDLLLSDNGRLKDPDRIRERVGIIDTGFQTTDLALAIPQFVEASSGSLEVGVRSIADQLARDLNRNYSLSLDTTEAEEALRSKFTKIFGEKVDLSHIIGKRTQEVAEVILSYAQTLWGRGQKLNRLILTGGGANLFRSYLSGYPNLHLPHESSLSNVRGYLKLARKTKW